MQGPKLAVMQPYLFPYLGYFQLVDAVDTFVFYDDVTFIKQGWIARNRLLVNGRPTWFTVPLARISSSRLIGDTKIRRDLYPRWQRKLIATLRLHYGDSPDLAEVVALVEGTLGDPPPDIASLAMRSVRNVAAYLGIDTPLAISSRDFPTADARGAHRILEICRAAGAATYVNAPGGVDLYDRDEFAASGIDLRFLHPAAGVRSAGSDLSILHLMLHAGVEATRSLLGRYSLA